LDLSIISDTFSPLIEEAYQIENFWKSYDNIQLNKRTCKKLGICIIDAVYNVKKLPCLDSYDDFFTLDNYMSFHKFLQNLRVIKSFIEDISQIRRLKSFIQEIDSGVSLEKLKDEYVKLLKEFHESTLSLGFNIQVDNNIDDINKDIEETKKISADIQNIANHKLVENEIIQESYNSEIVKYIKFSPSEVKSLSVQMALLKSLKGLVNISKFYGIKHENQMEITIAVEWSQYGDLMAYYKEYKLNTPLKLKFALEICNGLVFLNSVNFLHRAIKSENILIINDCKAKITNFCHSRLVTDESRKLDTM
ncbi:3_t:CDS:2, partial [Racocetra fulgida]